MAQALKLTIIITAKTAVKRCRGVGSSVTGARAEVKKLGRWNRPHGLAVV
ncbi:hypothetical protein [Candidatus Contubernalis alkaliaceticus]|nr:hypothetical protein [Candidatus Contubernalis alkalaceticus]UNC91788.1 hypothetical protein HUE98_06580 [Candidatus Contubernalis alkalaceticus]